MSRAGGKKRYRWTKISGHLFKQQRNPSVRGWKEDGVSLCGLTQAQAREAVGSECHPCEVAKEQLWA